MGGLVTKKHVARKSSYQFNKTGGVKHTKKLSGDPMNETEKEEEGLCTQKTNEVSIVVVGIVVRARLHGLWSRLKVASFILLLVLSLSLSVHPAVNRNIVRMGAG